MGDTNRSTYITMIRNPVDIFVSAWEYYKLGGSYKMTLGKGRLKQQCQNSVYEDEFARAGPNVTRRKGGMLGPNQLLFDLGVDDVYNEQAVDKKIMQMDEKFHLVMILEHFEV